jgi:hypothetical protein
MELTRVLAGRLFVMDRQPRTNCSRVSGLVKISAEEC